MTIRLLIADAHALVREALRLAFDGPEFAVIGEAATADEVVRLVCEDAVDAILMDVYWKSDPREIAKGLEALSQIRAAKPWVPVLVYSARGRETYINRCRELGASGYVVKGVEKQTLVAAMRAVCAGEEAWPTTSNDRSERALIGKGSS